MLRRSPSLILLLLGMGLVVAAGCSRSPEAQKTRHLERGDKYAARQKYREAIFEYRNVLRFDTMNARAIRQLGLVHHQLGEPGQAYGFLLKSQEIDPNDLEVRLKLAAIYLVARKPDAAREEAEFVLAREPRNLEALTVLGASANTPEQVDATIRRLEAARAYFGSQVRPYLVLATLYLHKRDMGAAERVFREALAKDPKSIEAHTALGGFYLSRQDSAQAEREFKTAADLAPAGSTERIRLADFYLLNGRQDEAKRILGETTKNAPDYLPASVRPRSPLPSRSTTRASRRWSRC
jgi:Flp pilus assembly protein TadD